MRKFLLSLLATFVVVLGASAVDTKDVLNQSVTGVTGTSYTDFSGVSVSSNAVYAGQCAGGYESIQLRSNKNNSGVVTTTTGGTAKKIVVTWNAQTADARELSVYGSATAYTAATDLYSEESQGALIAELAYADATDGVSTLEIDDEYAYIGFRSKSGALYLTSVEITWATGGEAPVVVKPTIAPNGGSFLTTQEVMLSCETEGAAIYYTLDESEPSAEATLYEGPFNVTQTTTVKAVAILNGAVSSVATATFNQIPNYSSFAEMSALENNATFAYTGEALVVAKPTDKYVYVTDDSGFGLIYDATGEKTAAAEVGKTIAANWTGKVSIYRQLFELVPDEAIAVKDGDAVAVSYPEASVADIVADNVNKVVTLKNITSYTVSGKNLTINVGENEVAGYNQFGLEIAEAEEGKTYQMVGSISRFDDNIQFQPISIEEQVEEPEPEPEYIVNAAFDPSADPIGWTEVGSEQYRDFGMYQIGGEASVRFAAPTADDTHLATEYAAGFECRWATNFAAYTQDVTLPAGNYKLTYDVENVNGSTTSAAYANRFTVTVGEEVFTDESTEWMQGKSAWTSHAIKFTLTEESTVTISLGYGTGDNNFGANNTPAIYVSKLALGTYDPLADAKETLQNEIETAEALSATEGYTAGQEEFAAAIADAKTSLTSATTKDELDAAVATLKAAEQAFVKTNLIAPNAALVAGASAENPVDALFVVNGTFTDNVSGWTCTGGFQNRTRASNQNGDFTVPFFENWNPSAKVNKMYQTIEYIPNGVYKLKIAAFVNTLANPNETQYVFANSDKVYLTTGEPTFYEVFTIVEDNTLEIGLEQTEAVANWMGIDNVSLTYFGADATIAEAKNAAFLKEVADVLAAKQSVKTKAALQAAYETFVAEDSEENKAAVQAAMVPAKESANSYAVLEAGSLPDNSLAGWTCTTFVEGQDVRWQVNTWSSEGNTDGTGMKTPFLENWTPGDKILGVGEIYYSLPGLDPGIYSFSALIRAYSEAGNAPTGASLFAGDREKEFATGKSFEFNDGKLKGIYDTYSMAAEVGEDGVFRFGIKVGEDRNFNWMAFKSCKVAYVGAAIDADAVAELAATMPEGAMNGEVEDAAAAAIATAIETPNLENYEAAAKAIAAAEASATAYKNVKNVLEAAEAELQNTNVYTAAAYEAYNTFIENNKTAYEEGTLTDAEGSALSLGTRRDGVLPSLLLSAFTSTVEGTPYINTWSWEGENDGTNFLTPFFEYWTGDANSLGENAITATMTDLEPGVYEVSAWVRVRAKNGYEAPAYGITLSANEGEAVDVAAGTAVENTQFFMNEFKAEGIVGEDGILKINFNVAADNNISWLSFKNVKITEVEPEPTIALSNYAVTTEADEDGDVKAFVSFDTALEGAYAKHELGTYFYANVYQGEELVLENVSLSTPTDEGQVYGTLVGYDADKNPVRLAYETDYTVVITKVEVLDYDLMDFDENENIIFPTIFTEEGTLATAAFTTPAAPVVEPETIEIAVNVDRMSGMGYMADEVEVDFTAAKEFLGVEEVAYDMLRIVNPDGTEISDYAPFDGWFNADGVAETWGSNTKVCAKFFQAIPDGKFEICDMNGADEVGATYSMKWALVANNKEVFYNITVTFVEPEKPEIAISDVTVKTSVEYEPTDASYLEKTATLSEEDVQTILTELGLNALSEATVYGYNPTTGELVANYAGYDGWRDANGDFHNWTGNSEAPACVKYNDGQTYYCYNISGLEAQTIKTYWAIANSEKAVLVEVDFTYYEPATVAISDVTVAVTPAFDEDDAIPAVVSYETALTGSYATDEYVTFYVDAICSYTIYKDGEVVASGEKNSVEGIGSPITIYLDGLASQTEYKLVIDKISVYDYTLAEDPIYTIELGMEETFTTPIATGISTVDTEAVKADGKYVVDGKVVIVKNGKTYSATGVQIK